MEDREQSGDRYRKKRHRLGEPTDRGAPGLPRKDQQRRDQRAGVADADPPDIVRDGIAPHDAGVDAPDADAGGKERVNAEERRDSPTVQTRKAIHQRRPAGRISGAQTRSVTARSSIGPERAGSSARVEPEAKAEALLTISILHGRRFDPREIGGARPRVELLQQRVMAWVTPKQRDGRLRIGEISELDRPRGTGALAGGDNLAFRDETASRARRDAARR